MNNIIKSSDFHTQTIELDESLKKLKHTNFLINAVQYWLDKYPTTTKIRFGNSLDPQDNSLYIMENMYGPKMKVFDSHKDFFDWCTKYIRPELQLHEREKDYFEKTIKNATGVQLKDTLKPHPKNMDLSSSKSVLNDFKTTILQYVNNRRPSKLYKCFIENDEFVWKPTQQYINEFPSQEFISDLKKELELENSEVFNMFKWNGANFRLKPFEHKLEWTPMPWSVIEPIVLVLKSKAVSENKNLGLMLLQQSNVPLIRGSHILLNPEQIWGRDDNGKLVGYVIPGRETNPGIAIGRDIEHFFDMAHAGKLGFFPYIDSTINEETASYMYHLQSFALEKELGEYLQNNYNVDNSSKNSFTRMPKELFQLVPGDRVFVSGDDFNDNPMWCTVKEKTGNIVSLFIENGHWQFDLDINNNKSLSHDIADIEGKLHIQSTNPSPYPHGSMYNDAIAYYHEHLKNNLDSIFSL